ncbi:hypothetical protein RMS29_027665 (plasmid) [Agrobacterium rosae]|uniref:Uncharacterized protein n=1 Tax=Agrobacterium rosae TaxID=1972867 RepID=A0AAW9FH43_9HYPH|nr:MULTISPECIES: hypothetical protein [Agrobacterium]MDX8321732.1 hypothetical protein [Agrobacterium sp. rho-8.1]MDX8305195.1 hypothetical protein [Agrobacterium rosae]MDX8311478.1 hypothetical protein [Agrobacterium sp. rho-13.3]MDX8316289.1 hypothetical protein [Agrobacterium rosae]MDX8332404.1 hypothetical protein [Agrobacterium rosae]
MALSVRDFRTRQGSGPVNLGNVHVKVEDYLRDQQGRAYAVQGTNLKDGSEVVIRLADPDRFAKLYLNPNEDLALRVKQAEEQIARRTTMREIGAARGNKAVPIDGVISISNVRPDLENGELYGRWPNAVVTDPEKEVAIPATFEVRTTLAKHDGKEFKTAFIQAYFPKSALPSEEVNRAALDKMLSGRLLDTGADMRTNIAVTVKLEDETGTYAFRPKMTQDASGAYTTTKDVETALSGKITRLNEAVAAVAVAAKAGIPFENLHIELPNQVGDKHDALRSLYESVADGSTPATFIPGATLQPSRFMVDAVLGRKVDQNGNVSNVRTPEQDLVDRGFVNGMLGVRYISNETGEIVSPVVKAMFPDGKLQKKESEYFVRHDLAAVGYETFLATHSPSSEDTPRLGHIEPARQPSEDRQPPAPDNDYAVDEENDHIYSDPAPDF